MQSILITQKSAADSLIWGVNIGHANKAKVKKKTHNFSYIKFSLKYQGNHSTKAWPRMSFNHHAKGPSLFSVNFFLFFHLQNINCLTSTIKRERESDKEMGRERERELKKGNPPLTLI